MSKHYYFPSFFLFSFFHYITLVSPLLPSPSTTIHSWHIPYVSPSFLFIPFHLLSSNREIIMISALKKRGKNLRYMYVCVFHDMGRLRWGCELGQEAKLVKRRSSNAQSDWHFGVREAWLWILFLQFTSCTTLFTSLPYSSLSFFIVPD